MGENLFEVLLNFLYILLLTTLGSTFVLSLKQRSEAIHLKLFLLSITLWVLSNFLADSATSEAGATFWARAAAIGPLLLGPTFYMMVKSSLKPQVSSHLKEKFPYIFVLILLPLVPTRFNIVAIDHTSFGTLYTPGPLYPIIFSSLIYNLANTALTLKKEGEKISKGLRDNYQYIFRWTTYTVVVASIFALLLPLLGITNLSFLGQASILLLCTPLTYLFTHRNSLGIEVQLGKIVYYLITTMVFATLLYLLLFIWERLSGERYPGYLLILLLTISALLGHMLFGLYLKLEPLIERELVTSGVDLPQLLNQITLSIATSLHPDQIVNIVSTNLTESGFVKSAKLTNKSVHKSARPSSRIVFSDNAALLLERNGPFNSTETQFIRTLEGEVQIAVARARLHQEALRFNKTLRSEIKSATRKLDTQYKELKNIRDAELEMLQIISHELRTPLSTAKLILGNLEIVGETSPESFNFQTFSSFSKDLKSALQKQEQLLETLLTASQIQFTTQQIVKERINLHQLLEDLGKMYYLELREKGLTIKYKLDGINEILSDRKRITLLLANLISNSIKYSFKGRILVECRKTDQGNQISVHDQGIGIPKAALKLIGKKFYRIHTDTHKERFTREYQEKLQQLNADGIGLGIYAVKRIVRQLGGSLSIESEPEMGTKVLIDLPI